MYSDGGKQAAAKIRSHIMWDLILAPACLQFYKSTDTVVSQIKWIKTTDNSLGQLKLLLTDSTLLQP